MKQEVKTKWLEALRSGEYQQATEVLRKVEHNPDGSTKVVGYCCLGVLCDLAIKDGVKIEFGDSETSPVIQMMTQADVEEFDVYPSEIDDEKDGYRVVHHDSEDLPPLVAEWAGLGGDSNPDIMTDDGSLPLSVFNDGRSGEHGGKPVRKRTFNEIADLIEEHL